MPTPDEPDGQPPAPEPPVASAPTARLKPNAGLSVALRGRIPAAALARGTDAPATRMTPPPPHTAAIAFGSGAGIVVEIDGDRVTLSLPTGRVVGTRAQARDLIDALLEALTH